jgi:hypothetical protein
MEMSPVLILLAERAGNSGPHGLRTQALNAEFRRIYFGCIDVLRLRLSFVTKQRKRRRISCRDPVIFTLSGQAGFRPPSTRLYRIFRRPLCLLSPLHAGKIKFRRFNGYFNTRAALMRIAKPLLLITTPLGLLDGFYECYRLAGGLLFLMMAMVGVLVAALGTVIATIRREERQSKAGPT